jgi:selenocysteine lyase/cysteine desulfurase
MGKLWEMERGQFPVADQLVYLNHAAVAPLVKPAAEAMQWLAQDACEYGSLHYGKWMETYEGVRVAAARMINSDKSEIAIVKNTSEGIATVAIGLDWKRGDKVVAFREEFPANLYPWKRLEAKGVTVEWLSIYDPLEKIDKACAGARMLAISFVNYLSGYRVDLEAIGEICKRHGCFYFVDAIQGMGAFPIDVQAAGIHALAADGHKWLLGPEGCGVLYVRDDVQDEIEPVEFGWTNVAGYADYANRDMALRPDAGRYEPGTLNTIGCFGLRAAMEYLLGIGIENVAVAVRDRAEQIATAVRAKGYEVLKNDSAETSSGIVSFRKDGQDCRMLVRLLKGAGALAAPRQGWVRTSPHFYVGPEDVERVLAALP